MAGFWLPAGTAHICGQQDKVAMVPELGRRDGAKFHEPALMEPPLPGAHCVQGMLLE